MRKSDAINTLTHIMIPDYELSGKRLFSEEKIIELIKMIDDGGTEQKTNIPQPVNPWTFPSTPAYPWSPNDHFWWNSSWQFTCATKKRT